MKFLNRIFPKRYTPQETNNMALLRAELDRCMTVKDYEVLESITEYYQDEFGTRAYLDFLLLIEERKAVAKRCNELFPHPQYPQETLRICIDMAADYRDLCVISLHLVQNMQVYRASDCFFPITALSWVNAKKLQLLKSEKHV